MPEALPTSDEDVAGLRHDLRTPLNQIIGYAELIGEDLGESADARTREDLEKIGRAARGLADLITREIQPGRIALTGKRAEPVAAKKDDAPAAGEAVAVPAAITARILIVDDQSENREVLQRRLEKEGHACLSAGDGTTALECLAGGEFDLVLLDIIMPDMDGREVLRRIKADEKLRHIPVIMISALDQLENVVECIELGAEDYLPKPFNPVLLRARIGASLERKNLRDAEQAAFAALKESQGKLAGELADAAAYVQGVLPAPMAEGPVTTSWQYRPSSSLGGDAFGYGMARDGTFGICLLDVCGHGVGAALLSISVLNVIRSESLHGVDFSDPGEVLAGLNTAFPMEMHGEMFFTAWCGNYDPGTRIMRFAAGGHPPAIVVNPDGSTSVLAAKGPVIGACEGARFDAQEAAIAPGARVFVFSDGAFEIQRHDGTMMTHNDLRAILARCPRGNAVEWVIGELQALNSQPEFDDDVSLVELCFP